MKKQSPRVKIAAVASSVLLAAGFVCYRADAFNENQQQSVNSPRGAAATGETIFGGSKSAEVFRDTGISDEMPTWAATADPIKTPKSPAMMSGSKSLIISEPTSSGSPKSLTIISGSKYGILERVPPTPAP
jgi:hypothetical protein